MRSWQDEINDISSRRTRLAQRRPRVGPLTGRCPATGGQACGVLVCQAVHAGKANISPFSHRAPSPYVSEGSRECSCSKVNAMRVPTVWSPTDFGPMRH